MNEKFVRNDGFYNQVFIIEDDGIYITDYNLRIVEKRAMFFPWGSIKSVKNSLGSIDILEITNTVFRKFNGEKQDRKKIMELWNTTLSKKNAAAKPCTSKICDIKTGKPFDFNKEHIVYCNICGNIFCYNEQDIIENERLKRLESQTRKEAVVSALGVSTIQSSLDSAEADRYKSRNVDYNKCPKCNSTNIKEITEDERKALEANKQKDSSVEEIKKFKELLDMGAITQEEFDAKKKQLLGL